MDLKLGDSLFYLFVLTNILGLTSFFMSFPLWPQSMIFISFIFWLTRVIALLSKSILNLLNHFSQVDLTLFICCLIVFIEVLSLCIRRITLAFRLLANILGGHLILELASTNHVRKIIIVFLFTYELFVSFVQSLIFSTLIYYYTLEGLEKL